VLVTVSLGGTNFSVKRRMRPARHARARRDSSNAFILRFAGAEGFFISAPRWSLNQKPVPCLKAGNKLKDQHMLKVHWLSLALAGSFLALTTQGQFADAVVSYDPGSGYSPGFTNAAAALGEPSRITPGTFGGPVDPFDPPYLASQLVSIGEAGSLTVHFARPVLNNPLNRFGIDFIVFGNAGFIITNAFDFTTFDWIGTPATDGSLFGNNPGKTRVSVSKDGVSYYALNPDIAPTVDNLAPTEGTGDFHTPVDPELTQNDFAGLTLKGIRSLYLGSAGGAGYDISWAQDASGQSVFLSQISFVRIAVIEGKAEIDGIAAVFVPRGLNR
jgi:hypothetical protein